MKKKSSILQLVAYYVVKLFAGFIRLLPAQIALAIGRVMGKIMYIVDVKHKSIAYANINMAFAGAKTTKELRQINKQLFENLGQNLIELFRLPLINREIYEKYIDFEGRHHIDESLAKGKGCILLAMHFGSWEMANISCAMYDYPYNVLVRKQPRYSRLNELLNSYRACNGSLVLNRGTGTRGLVKSLKNNEVIGMVVDQGGKDGYLVPFFNRQASMSVGAIKMGLKLGAPICFSVIIRQKGPYHKIVVHKPFNLINTGNMERDITVNLHKITELMEKYTRDYPSEYVWMYKIWKYSDQAHIAILSDGKTGHLRQSETVAKLTQQALSERNITATVSTIDVNYKNSKKAKWFSFLHFFMHPFLKYGRHDLIKHFLTEKTYKELTALKADYIISCGSSVASLNHLFSRDRRAKSIAILKPGLVSYKHFDLILIPHHDVRSIGTLSENMKIMRGAPNLIDDEYLKEQQELLLNRFSHLKSKVRYKIGLLIGGDAKNVYVSEDQVRLLIRQVKEAADAINADLLVTTSRRTPAHIDQLLYRKLKKDPRCLLLILPNRDNVPEAMGGIISLSDLLIVSGDSISMVSEAASSGKKTIVFLPKNRELFIKSSDKHREFVQMLNERGFILSSHTKDIGQSIFDMTKNKIQTRPLDDNKTILKAIREII